MDRCEAHNMTCQPTLAVEVLRVEERLTVDADPTLVTCVDAALDAGARFDTWTSVVVTAFADIDEPIGVVGLLVCASPHAKTHARTQ
jgi:hypothetical protein